MSDPELTHDTLLGGRVRYTQPARGYRVGLEAPLLAAFSHVEGRKPPRLVIDLASGPGAVALCLAQALPHARLVLVEKAPLHADLARRNLTDNALDDRAEVLCADASEADTSLGRGVADLVVSNPPWYPRDGGQPEAQGAVREGARGLGPAGFAPFCQAARQLLGRGGRFCLTAPASSLAALLVEMRTAGLEPKRLRLLHPRLSEEANAVFVEAQSAKPGGLRVEPPWAVRGEGDAYTDEMKRLLWG